MKSQFNRRQPVKNPNRINREIRVPEVRLIDQNGEQLGVVQTRQALAKAEEAELDLVEISPTAKPPVCKIMDYGKFLYEKAKTQKEQKKKQKAIQIKEVKFRPNTDDGDYQVKLRNLKRFLEDGNKAKISVRFRGREIVHSDLAVKLFERLKADLADYANVESQSNRVEGRQLFMMLAPKK